MLLYSLQCLHSTTEKDDLIYYARRALSQLDIYLNNRIIGLDVHTVVEKAIYTFLKSKNILKKDVAHE